MFTDTNGNQFDSYEQAVRCYGGDVDDADEFDYEADDSLLIAIEAMQGEIETRNKLIYNFEINGGRDPEYARAQRFNIARLERAIKTLLRIKKAL